MSISPKKPRLEITECKLQKKHIHLIYVKVYYIYNIFTQAEGAVRHLASREPNHDNNFGQVVMDLDCGDQEGVGHEGDPNKL